jgi:hypothetical protein
MTGSMLELDGPTDIRQALEAAAAELRRVDAAWTEDASSVLSAANLLEPNPRKWLADPPRVDRLREALAIIEWFVDDMADADNGVKGADDLFGE